jgi:hypothetical protein
LRVRARSREDVEDDQLFLEHALAHVALLFGREVAAQREQLLKYLLDVRALPKEKCVQDPSVPFPSNGVCTHGRKLTADRDWEENGVRSGTVLVVLTHP